MRSLTTHRVMLITLFLLIFAMAIRAPADTDTWWHIRSGEYTLSHGMIRTDPFSHTMSGEPWINHSWGAQIVLYAVWEIAGNTGLALYTAVLATAGLAVLYPVCAGNVYSKAFVFILAAAAAAVFWMARPQMVSFFFSGVIVALLYAEKQHREQTTGIDRLWFIPLLMLVWGNLHAGFTLAFILIFGVLVGESLNNFFPPGGEQVIPPARLKKLALVTGVAAAALVINPYGVALYRVPLDTVSIGALQEYIQEWNSPNFHDRSMWPFAMLLFATLGAVGASPRRLDWTGFFLVCGTAFMGLMAGRNVAVFAVAAVPTLTLHLHAALAERGLLIVPRATVTRQQARLNMTLVLVIVFGVMAYTASKLAPDAVDAEQREKLPVQVIEFLQDAVPPGPMFNSYNLGGYLMFALPDYPVYVDGRTDLYKNTFLTHYLIVSIGGADWREALDAEGINLVIIETGAGLELRLRESPDWACIYPNDNYPDTLYTVYRRR